MKTWDNIDDIIFCGTADDVENLKCIECGGKLDIQYSDESHSLSIHCTSCGYLSRQTGCYHKPRYLK
jgi:Zn ribbon nucleic-acid-binding protein